MTKYKIEGHKIIGGKEYRLVTIRNRGKWIAKDGSAINPIRKAQKVTMHLNEDKYPCFGGSVPVHLYVGHAWVDGYFEGAEINHKDFNRMNYNADNLEWITHEENVKYSATENREEFCKSKQGINNGRAKYTEEEVLEIRKLYNNGMSVMEIVKIHYPTYDYKQRKNEWSRIADICKGKTWNNLKSKEE